MDKSIITPVMITGPESPASRAVLIAASAGLAAYGTSWVRAATATILNHAFKPEGLFLAVFLGLGVASYLLLSAAGPATHFWPLAVLPAAPFLFLDYFDRGDAQRRLFLLGLFAAAAVVYLWAADAVASRERRRHERPKLYNRFLRLPVKKRLWVLFLAAFLVYNLCALALVLEGVTFSGDEPNYLLTTHSLVADGDINLANNFKSRDWFHFYEEKDNPRLRMSPYARAGIKGRDYIYPINLPGISVLMAPFYAVSQAVDGLARTLILKGSLSIWAVLLGLQIYLLARSLWKREGPALGLWALYAASSPVLFYAVHLYPEIPIALFSVYVYRMARAGRSLSALQLAFLGALLGSFFWFGLKYNMIFWPLLAAAVFYLWPAIRPRARLLWLVVPALAGLALFYYSVWIMYGTLSPLAVYEGVLGSGRAEAIARAFLDLPHLSRIETFLDYFLDQRDGLLLYAPFWIFLIPGFVEMFRRGRKTRIDLLGLLLIAGPFILNYAFFTHRQGFCPQGRVLAPVSWIAVIGLGYFLDRKGKGVFGWLFGLGTAAAAAVSWILLRHPGFLTQPTTHEVTTRAGDLFVHLSNVRFLWPPYLPSFLKIDNTGYLPNYVWVGLVAGFIAAYLFFGKAKDRPLSGRFHGIAAAVLLGAALFFWVLFPRVPLYPSWPVSYSTGGSLGFYLMPMGRGVVAKNEGEMYLHFEKSYRFIFASREKVERLRLGYGSEKGEHEIRMAYFDTPLLSERTSREMRELVFEPKAAYRLGGLYLYEIGLSLRKTSAENLLEDPYLLRISPLR